LCFDQTGAIIEDDHTARNRQPTTDTAANVKSEYEKLEITVGNDDASRAAAVEESEMKEDTEDKPQLELVTDKLTEAAQETKTEPTEEIEVEVEEFYVKYKNL